jgi:nucleoside-diphosphate-sugar epimerase
MIAILGATGTLGLSLARELAADAGGLVLFARHPQRLANVRLGSTVGIRPLDEFAGADFDLVINAIGAGDPGRVAALGDEILAITAQWDRRVLDTMDARTCYVFLSSGAVHASSFTEPDRGGRDGAVSAYVTSKRTAEARHRALGDRSILDLRVFGYADTALPRDGRFFLCELARSVILRVPFRTLVADMVRDYAGRAEVASLIKCWVTAGARNMPLDVYTKEPASKRDILRIAHERFGVEIEYRDDVVESRTGATQIYASFNRDAASLGYDPKRTSLEVVTDYLDGIAGSDGPVGDVR